jgi:5-methylcytosine-specific restriction endonuclease McrA
VTRSRRAQSTTIRSTTTRDRHRRRRPPRHCANCGAHGVGVRLIQDHCVNLAAGGADTIANLQWLCSPCHDAKTRVEQQAGRDRARAQRGSLSRRYRDLEAHPGRMP